ncbi:MAG: exonuclease SbcCD subunit D [Bacteroidetes Order II. Incertae sedis bacterium]|nr:exonuclease SbcCD subunit D [Bacteroidetes Order II. bacterium]
MKILHTADIHIGYENFGRLDPATGLNTRLLDFKRCFDFMVETAIREQVDVFLFCGDAYRTHDPSPTQQKIFADCLKPIADAGIPMVMLTGNHDQPVSFGKASSISIFEHLAGKVTIFEHPDLKVIQTASGPLQVLGLPWPVRSKLWAKEEHKQKSPSEVREMIETKYAEYVHAIMEQDVDPMVPCVLAAHLTVQGAEMSGSERSSVIQHEPTFLVSSLAHPKLDYVALGHIHRFQDRNKGHKPPVVYASSIERVTFKEADAEKGFVLVNITGHGRERETQYRFVETPARRFVSVLVDVRDYTNPTDRIIAAIGKQVINEAIVRVRYEINEDQTNLVDIAAIRAELATAASIASIERVIELRQVQRTAALTRDASLKTAMEAYIARHEYLQPIGEDLIENALALDQFLLASEAI